jgi:hypothetical protein
VDAAIDTTHNRAIVIDYGLDAVIAVDLTTGERSIVSGDSTPDTKIPVI